MGLKIYVNGKFFDEEDARVSVFDHGYFYGDGLFECIRACNSSVFRLKEHVDRFNSVMAINLQDGDQIRIDIPAPRLEVLTDKKIPKERRLCWKAPDSKTKTGYMQRHAHMVQSASTGAIYKV